MTAEQPHRSVMDTHDDTLHTTVDQAATALVSTIFAVVLAGLFGHSRAVGIYVLSGMTFDGPPALAVGLQVAGISGCVALSVVAVALTARVVLTVGRTLIPALRSNSARENEEEE